MGSSEVRSPCVEDGGAKVISQISVEEILNSYDAIGVDVRAYIDRDVEIYRCNQTGYRFYYPHDLAGNSEFYSMLSSTRKYYSDWRWEHQVALSHFEKSRPKKIFEFGCGPGNFLARNCGSELYGSDFNKSLIAVLQDRGRINLVESSTFDQELKDAGIDAVCLFQVLEHIPNVYEFMNRINRVLCKNGTLVVGVPNNNPYLYRWDVNHALNMPPHHMGLWDRTSLCKVLRNCGYKTIKIEFEPFSSPEHWLKVNLVHYLGEKIGYRAYKKSRRYFSNPAWMKYLVRGRNLVGIFAKQ